MSKAVNVSLNEQDIDQAIHMVFDELERNFYGGRKVLESYGSNPEYSQLINKRLDVVLLSMQRLGEVSKIQDLKQREQSFLKVVETLEDTKNQDLQNIALSLDFLKNIDRKMGEA